MGQVLHGSARTTAVVRRAIQRSEESLRALARRYGVNQKTIIKWRKRTSTADLPTGPKDPRSSSLTIEEEAVVVAFRRHTLLPLDDCLYALQATIPRLTRSSLHRCLQRHGISRLPEVDGDKPAKKKFKPYPIGYFHIDIAEVSTAEGKLYLYVAIDRTSKFAFIQLVKSANRVTASAFLEAVIAAVPYKIHTILTDNGIQFTFPPRYADGPTARYMTHMFDMRCEENGIEHRLTKVRHPWTNGQVERMNRTIKEATVKRYHYDTHRQLETHLTDFIGAYNYARRLKTLRGLTPYEFICKAWGNEPQRFINNPHHNQWDQTPSNLRIVRRESRFGADPHDGSGMTPPSARGGVTAGLETFCRAERTFAIGPAVVAHEARDVNFGVPLMLKTVRSTIIFIVISSMIGFLLGTLGIDGLTRATISIGFASVAAMILNVTWAKRAQQQVDGAEKSELLARAAAADRSVILFFREGFNGKLAGVDVGVDDAIVAQLGTPAGTRVAVMPGQRKLSARTAGNMGGKPGVLTIDVRPGETLAVQIKMGIGTIKLLPQSDTNAVRHRMSGMTIVRPEKDEA